MSEPTDPPTDPLKRPVPLKEALPALLGVALLLTGLVLIESGYKLIGTLVAAPVMVYVMVAIFRIPKEQTERLAKAMEEQNKKPIWQFINIIQLAALLFILASGAAWLYERL